MIQNFIIPLNPEYLVDYDDVLGVDADQSPADVAVFGIHEKCELVRTQVVVTETNAGGTTTPEVDFDLRPTAGSDSSRGAADMGHHILSTTAGGKVMYDKVGKGTILYPGQEIVCELKTAATGTNKAGHFRPMVLVKPIPETEDNLSNMVETA